MSMSFFEGIKKNREVFICGLQNEQSDAIFQRSRFEDEEEMEKTVGVILYLIDGYDGSGNIGVGG